MQNCLHNEWTLVNIFFNQYFNFLGSTLWHWRLTLKMIGITKIEIKSLKVVGRHLHPPPQEGAATIRPLMLVTLKSDLEAVTMDGCVIL